MDWANEKYVRLFVRDTTTWKLLPWQSKALLPLIMRKLDRSGIIDLGEDGEEGLAAVVEVPLEFLQAGLPALLKRDVYRVLGGKLVMPNFLAAQEARQSDAQRKRESRENQRLAAMKSQSVTECPESSQSHEVTTCHASSVLVTPDYPQTIPCPDQTNADLSRARSNLPANEPGKPSPANVVRMFLTIRGQVIGGSVGVSTPFAQPQRNEIEKAEKWLAGMTAEESSDIEPAIRLACKHVADGAQGWTHESITKTGFLFGAIVTNWRDLREELHGCAPKASAPKRSTAEHPKIWKTVER